jgi:hypothetical protein
MKRNFSFLITLSLIISFTACAPSTMITGSWLNKSGFEGHEFKSVFIAAMTSNMSVKSALEEAFAKEAALRNLTSIKSIDFFKPSLHASGVPTKEEILNQIRASGSETILTINLKDKENQTRYVPGSSTYSPTASNNYYNNFYGYYSTAYVENYTEGYYTTDKVYFIECNLYNAANEELLWSAQSETTNPSKVEAFAKEYAAIIVAQLKSDRLLKGK